MIDIKNRGLGRNIESRTYEVQFAANYSFSVSLICQLKVSEELHYIFKNRNVKWSAILSLPSPELGVDFTSVFIWSHVRDILCDVYSSQICILRLYDEDRFTGLRGRDRGCFWHDRDLQLALMILQLACRTRLFAVNWTLRFLYLEALKRFCSYLNFKIVFEWTTRPQNVIKIRLAVLKLPSDKYISTNLIS